MSKYIRSYEGAIAALTRWIKQEMIDNADGLPNPQFFRASIVDGEIKHWRSELESNSDYFAEEHKTVMKIPSGCRHVVPEISTDIAKFAKDTLDAWLERYKVTENYKQAGVVK